MVIIRIPGEFTLHTQLELLWQNEPSCSESSVRKWEQPPNSQRLTEKDVLEWTDYIGSSEIRDEWKVAGDLFSTAWLEED